MTAARKFLIVCILLGVTGGQWMLLQSAAWAGMIVSNLRHDSLHTALSDTFDGRHPCPLCKAIESSKKSEKKSEVVTPIPRIEFPPGNDVCRSVADEYCAGVVPVTDEFAESIRTGPRVRPPRLIPA
jgi:hypothetical protein